MLMSDVYDIRRKNMRKLAEELGGAVKLADLMQIEQSYMSAIIGKKPVKSIGKIIARKAEEASGKPVGWLDQDHDFAALNRELLLSIIGYVDQKYPNMPAKQRADLIADLYYEVGGETIPENNIHLAVDMWVRAKA